MTYLDANFQVAQDLQDYASTLKGVGKLNIVRMVPYTDAAAMIRDSKLDIGNGDQRKTLLNQIGDSEVRRVAEELTRSRNPKSVDELVGEIKTPELRVVKPPERRSESA